MFHCLLCETPDVLWLQLKKVLLKENPVLLSYLSADIKMKYLVEILGSQICELINVTWISLAQPSQL